MVKDIHVELRGVDHRNDLKGILDSIPNLCSARCISHTGRAVRGVHEHDDAVRSVCLSLQRCFGRQ